MRRSAVVLLLAIFSSVFLSACAAVQDKSPIKKNSLPVIVRTGVYEGLVSVDGDSVYIITNYKSRSRVDYRVEGNLKNKIAALDGQVITVVGTATRQGWSGTIDVVKILKPKKIPPSSPTTDK